MGPWLADTIRQCDGMTQMMSYWTFSDVFEEQGVVKTPFYGGYGLISVGHVHKPAYNAFELLHKLGDQRINVNSDSALVTRRSDGSLVLAVWNYAPPEESGAPKTMTLRFPNATASHARIWRVDATHGDFQSAYEKMGQPRYPTESQYQQLRSAAALSSAEERDLARHELTVNLPAKGLAVIEIR
jgi:xylan 1,4-beta-xylosidase